MDIWLGGAIAIAMSLIGFISVWIKMGIEKGEQKRTIQMLEQKTEENKASIVELKNTTHSIQLDIAKSIGSIEAKLDGIKETITTWRGGDRRAAKK